MPEVGVTPYIFHLSYLIPFWAEYEDRPYSNAIIRSGPYIYGQQSGFIQGFTRRTDHAHLLLLVLQGNIQ